MYSYIISIFLPDFRFCLSHIACALAELIFLLFPHLKCSKVQLSYFVPVLPELVISSRSSSSPDRRPFVLFCLTVILSIDHQISIANKCRCSGMYEESNSDQVFSHFDQIPGLSPRETQFSCHLSTLVCVAGRPPKDLEIFKGFSHFRLLRLV